MIWFAFALLACAAFFVWRHRAKSQARAALLAAPLSDEDRAVVLTQVPIIGRLPADLGTKLEGKINLFLDQVDFIGCDGLEVSDTMRLSIAAQACLLVVNSDTWYDTLTSVLVYPGAFKSRQSRQQGYVVSEKEIVRTGESWNRGPVILSWAHSQHGAQNDHDGQNVVFHEFAHQIDALSGSTNGVPILGPGQSFADWEKAFLTAYKAHVDEVEHGHRTVISAYGAVGHEEFFAVSVEVFFERPKSLRREAPAVYAQLSKLFQLDPQTW